MINVDPKKVVDQIVNKHIRFTEVGTVPYVEGASSVEELHLGLMLSISLGLKELTETLQRINKILGQK